MLRLSWFSAKFSCIELWSGIMHPEAKWHWQKVDVITELHAFILKWYNTMNHLQIHNKLFPAVQSWICSSEQGAECICAHGRTPCWALGTISAHCHIRGAKLPCSSWKMHGFYLWAHLHFRASSYLASHGSMTAFALFVCLCVCGNCN